MKLDIEIKKPNTQTVQFRIDPDTKQMLTFLRKHYGCTSGVLLKQMIKQSYESISIPKGTSLFPK